MRAVRSSKWLLAAALVVAHALSASAAAPAPAPEPVARSPLAYLPPDTEFVVSASAVPAALDLVWWLPPTLDLVEMDDAYFLLAELFGVKPGWIQGPARVTVGAELPEGWADQDPKKPPPAGGRKGAAGDFRNPVLVIQSAASLRAPDREALGADGARPEEVRHRGRAYYRPAAPGKGKPDAGKAASLPAGYAALAADERTVVCAREDHVRSLIEAGDKIAVPHRLAFIDVTHHATLASVPRKKGAFGPPADRLGMKLPAGLDAHLRAAEGWSVGLTYFVPAEGEPKLKELGLPTAEGRDGRARQDRLRKLGAGELRETRFACRDAEAAGKLRDLLADAIKKEPATPDEGEVGEARVLDGVPVVSVEAIRPKDKR